LREEGIEPVGFWYNPNIHPFTEYLKRRDTLEAYAESIDMEMIVELEDDDMVEMYEGFLAEMCEEENAPEECEVKTKENKVTLTASGNSEVLEIEEDMTKEDVIELMEDDGFTCK